MTVECEIKSASPQRNHSTGSNDVTNVRSSASTDFSPAKRDRHHSSTSSHGRSSPARSKETKYQSMPNGTELNECGTSNKSDVQVLDTAPLPNFPFRHTCTVRESHGQSIFGISFNSINRSCSSDPLLFATTASHYVSIYQCNFKNDSDDQSTNSQNSAGSSLPPILLLQSFTDPAGEEEEFYCCAWSRDTAGNSDCNWLTDCAETGQFDTVDRELHPHQCPLTHSHASLLPAHQQVVAAAGKRGVIRILCPRLAKCSASLIGHGAAINELRFHPRDPALLFSFSKDYTVRLWNIASQVLVAIFGGAEGHRAEVLHGDLSLTGDHLLSAGMDHCVKIWRLNTPELANAIVDSFTYRARSNPKPFNVIVQHFPEFSSRDVHGNYVDCARWFGCLIISKSCENTVSLWKPGSLDDAAPAPQPGISPLTEVGGIRLPSRLQPVGISGADVSQDTGSHQPMPGVPTEHKLSIIHQLRAPECNLWYIRFDIDLVDQILALGTGTGPTRIYLWDLSQPEVALNLIPQVLTVPALTGQGLNGASISQSAIRQTRFANDGKTLIGVGDNGLIVRFDRI